MLLGRGLRHLALDLRAFARRDLVHLYKRPRHILVLFAVAVLENFGYRQLNTLWRTAAVFQHLHRGARARLARRKQECRA